MIFPVQELVNYTSELLEENLPDTVIVSGMEKIIEKSWDVKSDTKFALGLAKLTAVLRNFSIFCSEKNSENPTKLLAVSKFSTSQEKFISSKLSLWFPEIWELYEEKIVCKTSPSEIIVNFSLKDEEYFLDSFSSN